MKIGTEIIGTYGKGFLENSGGIRVLHLKGSPYERGYQHGTLLASEITNVISDGITGAASVVATALQANIETGLQKLKEGQKAAGPYIPPEFREEMTGIADGIASKGSPMTLDDVLLWNTMYDSWCFFAHPDPSDPNRPAERHAYPPGCSSCSTWGDATQDGSLIMGKNMDNLDLPGILENRILVISDPDHGFGHANITHPGMIAIDGGFNEGGIEMMTQYSPSIYETMSGCGIGILSRLILQYAHTINDAVNILTVYPRCTGINYHVTDAKVNRAAVIEVSASEAAIRRPEKGTDALWTSNHYNCYPGWKGYTGKNMVKGQAPVYKLQDISTIEKWQEGIYDPKNDNIAGAGRFKRYEKLVKENYGRITAEKMMQIMSDRINPDTGEEREWEAPSGGFNDGVTICMFTPLNQYGKQVPFYKNDKKEDISARFGNLWSLVAVPGSGDFYLAMQDFPAQRGGYVHFNLKAELQKTR